MNENRLPLIGQIAGYSTTVAAWFDLAKDIVGLVGLIAGAALSVWALIDRIKKHREAKK